MRAVCASHVYGRDNASLMDVVIYVYTHRLARHGCAWTAGAGDIDDDDDDDDDDVRFCSFVRFLVWFGCSCESVVLGTSKLLAHPLPFVRRTDAAAWLLSLALLCFALLVCLLACLFVCFVC